MPVKGEIGYSLVKLTHHQALPKELFVPASWPGTRCFEGST